MSSNYSAQQFNDAFHPRCLQNWETPANRDFNQRPRKCHLQSQRQSFPYFLVSDQHGRLLPSVREQLITRQQHAAWAQLSQFMYNGCDCTSRRKNQDQEGTQVVNSNPRFPVKVPSFFRGRKLKERNRQSSPKSRIDPFLVYLRELALPTIWVLGVPTTSIRSQRKKLCQEIAEQLDFAYVDLDDCIANWTIRQMSSERGRFDEYGNENSNPDGIFGVIPNYRTMKPKKTIQPQQMNQNGDRGSFSFPSTPITFSTNTPFTTENVLNLLKFAMVEALPANGFVLDGFPCNLHEAAEFERCLYPVSLALYFVPSENGNGGRDDPLSFPIRFRRKFQFTLQSGEILCSRRNYGRKVIRVLETENVDTDTVSFLHQVIRDNLARENDKDSTVGDDYARDVGGVFFNETLITPKADEDINVITSTDVSPVTSPRRGDRRQNSII